MLRLQTAANLGTVVLSGFRQGIGGLDHYGNSINGTAIDCSIRGSRGDHRDGEHTFDDVRRILRRSLCTGLWPLTVSGAGANVPP